MSENSENKFLKAFRKKFSKDAMLITLAFFSVMVAKYVLTQG